jgi:hypothetical protein
MNDHTTATKTANSHTSMPLGSVANTLTNQHHQKVEPIDYTADESMIAVSGNIDFRLIFRKLISIGFYGCFTST